MALFDFFKDSFAAVLTFDSEFIPGKHSFTFAACDPVFAVKHDLTSVERIVQSVNNCETDFIVFYIDAEFIPSPCTIYSRTLQSSRTYSPL